MENAELIGVSRQIALRNHMDVIANNLANINTTGYKGQKLAFEEYLMPVASANSFQRSDRTLSYVHDYMTRNDFANGAIIETGNPLDVAIKGEGWFAVQTPSGERYTRDGSFLINNDGELVTTSGHKVLTEGGVLTFSADEQDVAIGPDGVVSTSAGEKGQLRVVKFEGPDSFTPVGDNFYVPKEGIIPERIPTPRLAQGAIEKSNVKGVSEISKMIHVTRTYQMVTNMIKEQEQLREKAIERLGRLDA